MLAQTNADLILGLGDYAFPFWEHVTAPTFFVYGNHDTPAWTEDIITRNDHIHNLHGVAMDFHGVRIGGIEGRPYLEGKALEHSEEEVVEILKEMGKVDILITHAPPTEHELSGDSAHQGFQALSEYIHVMQPSFVFHGHVNHRKRSRVGNTIIQGVFGLHTEPSVQTILR